jgi:hypothetical protein
MLENNYQVTVGEGILVSVAYPDFSLHILSELALAYHCHAEFV